MRKGQESDVSPQFQGGNGESRKKAGGSALCSHIVAVEIRAQRPRCVLAAPPETQEELATGHTHAHCQGSGLLLS